MSLYNMINGFNPACTFILPMLNKKIIELPRFRDCFVDGEKKEIIILTRVGGNNRNSGYNEEELYDHPNFLRTEDHEDDDTYGLYYFSIPEQWKKDFEVITNDDGFSVTQLSNEYKEHILKIHPNISERLKNILEQGE